MNDFWDTWEEVISELRVENKSNLADELQESRMYLNGLIDGGTNSTNQLNKSLTKEEWN